MTMTTRNLGRVWAVLLALNVVTAIFAEPDGDTPATQTPARPVIDVYISTGDNFWMGQGLPIDSKASIEATFDLLKEVGVRRVYWRGLQEATSLETLQELPENTLYYAFYQYLRDLYKRLDPDRLAVEIGHQRGMEIWGIGNLVDWGGSPDMPCYGDYPLYGESRMRTDQPEWVPVDRRGVLKQGGMIELAYPEARKAIVDLYSKVMDRDRYDGMILFTYAENFSMRFQDEFGFNEPIVQEFKKRHGFDLRHDRFNGVAGRSDWYRLRGEYLTCFMKEMKAELDKRGQRLGIYVNAQDPHFPLPWVYTNPADASELLLPAGRIHLDLRQWIQDGTVDLLLVFNNGTPAAEARTVRDLLWMSRQTSTEVAFVAQNPGDPLWRPLIEQRIAMVPTVGDFGAPFLRTSAIEPLSSLKTGSPGQRLRTLLHVFSGRLKAAVDDIAPSASDPNVLVRRAAMHTLASLKDPKAVPIIEQGLLDAEPCVRYYAVEALGELHGPETVEKVFAAVDRSGVAPMMVQATNTLLKIGPPASKELIEAAHSHKNAAVRAVAMQALAKSGEASALDCFQRGLDDADRRVRFAAAEGLGNVKNSVEAMRALVAATTHDDPVVSDRAATSIATAIRRNENDVVALKPRILDALKTLYGKLGDGCTRVDALWGYRPVGNALLIFGPDGEAVLRAFMDQTNDRRLAEQAWRSLYIRQDNNSYHQVTEEQNEEAFRVRK